MPTFDSLPENSFVLLTLPILIYGIFTRHPEQSYPLSPECSVLLENCRTGRFRGVITTAIVTRCWTVLQKLESRVEDPEVDPDDDDDDWLRKRILSKRTTRDSVPKRIAGLLGGQLRIAIVEIQDFDSAGDLVRDFGLTADLAVDIMAVSREFGIKTLNVALSEIRPWPNHAACIPYWCQDLPWQRSESRPLQSVSGSDDLILRAKKLVKPRKIRLSPK